MDLNADVIKCNGVAKKEDSFNLCNHRKNQWITAKTGKKANWTGRQLRTLVRLMFPFLKDANSVGLGL